ncbi:MAG: TauD/TfdA dioxygenase family protein [Alphaproteobacteria bacterium]
MRNYRYIGVRPLAGALGAEIDGIDLSEDLGTDVFAEIKQAFLDHLVVFFRDQDITPAQQVAFARRFGGIHLHPYMRGLPEQPEVLEIRKEPDDTYTFGSVWHTDQMFNPQPAMATMLYAHEVPPYGGDTMFANMYLALERLSPAMQAMLAGQRSHCVGDTPGKAGSRADRYGGKTSMATNLQERADPITAEHPLVRTHPETGRRSLYIGVHVQRLAGMTEAESGPLLGFLREHATKPEFTCRFRWAPGSLALWDNRCTQHYAVPDYQGQRRRMHRVTIEGDRPA